MIFTHAIIGLIAVEGFKFSWFWFIGSTLPDIDHIFVLVHNKIFSWSKILDSFQNEEKYGIRMKTKYFHSFFGAIILSLPVILFNVTGGIYFFTAYLLHLLLDWPDKDIKQYLYPFKIEFKGFLPIFSKIEQIFACALSLLVISIYVFKYFYIK